MWAAAPAAPALGLAADPELDCARPAEARAYIALLRLAEIEGAEDIHRAAMWEAFGHCPEGDGGAPCRVTEQRRFEGRWEVERRAIEDKYRDVQAAYDARCRGAISQTSRGVRAVS
ncbi:MAG TPA: hypothetical protein VN914_05885 [Polyangia bacterium]|nr:hypothetical protein [Polyangia bacterium]